MSFQSVYDWLKNIKSPKWYVDFCQYVIDHIIIPSLERLGQEYMAQLKSLIIYASQQNWDNQSKVEYVFSQMRPSILPAKLSDNGLNVIIELTVAELKRKQIIP